MPSFPTIHFVITSYSIHYTKLYDSELLTEVAALSRKERDTVFLGIWTVRDMLAHLAGWDYANLEAAKSILAGELPSFYVV